MSKKPSGKQARQRKALKRRFRRQKERGPSVIRTLGRRRRGIPMAYSSPLVQLYMPTERPLAELARGVSDVEAPSRKYEARFLCYDAWEASRDSKARALANKALKKDPDCADAYNILAEVAAGDDEEALGYYEKGVRAGERTLDDLYGSEWRDGGEVWKLEFGRPYMRARWGAARKLWALGRREESVEMDLESLELNRGDNQGIRWLVVPNLITLGLDGRAREVLGGYMGEDSPYRFFAELLLLFRAEGGDAASVRRAFHAAFSRYAFVATHLADGPDEDARITGMIVEGSEEEAAVVSHVQYEAWESTPGALEWLREQLDERLGPEQ